MLSLCWPDDHKNTMIVWMHNIVIDSRSTRSLRPHLEPHVIADQLSVLMIISIQGEPMYFPLISGRQNRFVRQNMPVALTNCSQACNLSVTLGWQLRRYNNEAFRSNLTKADLPRSSSGQNVIRRYVAVFDCFNSNSCSQQVTSIVDQTTYT